MSADRTQNRHASRDENRRKDRRRSRRFVLHERRSGFDRRLSYPVTGPLREQPLALFFVLLATNALSAMDFLLTYRQLQLGMAIEANPVLADLFAQGPARAWAFKATLMLMITIGIWIYREHRQVLVVATIGLLIYIGLIAYHITGMSVSTIS